MAGFDYPAGIIPLCYCVLSCDGVNMLSTFKEMLADLIKENLRVEVVTDWRSGTFFIKLFWGETMFYKSNSSIGSLT